MDLLIKNGTLVSSSGKYKADISVVNGVISEIGKNLIPDKATKVVDATGKLVLPGAIDLHTHLAMPFGGTVSADDYFAGTRAAVCGGTTTVFDFALQDFNESILDTVKRRDAICAPDAACDYAFHVGIKDLSNGLLTTMDDAVKFGVPTFKAFMVYDFGVQDGDLFRLLEHSKKIGARVSVHAENRDAIAVLTKRFLEEGKTSAWYHYMSRPEWVEEEADIRAINFAKALGAPLYIVHVGSKGGIEAIERAKKEGVEVYAETCPQYLEFTSDVYKRNDARDFVCSPPMKGKESKDALWRAINMGVVDTVATDHCPFQKTEKDWGKDDFTKIPNGCAGVENMYPYMLSEANKGKTTIETVVKLCSENPAKLSGCKKKGFLKPGYDADIVIYDPKLDFTITNEKMHSDCDHTIWEGKKLKGYPVMTFSRGRLVYENGEFKGERGWGKMVKRSLK
ncbi:MAG: dihydropyrimidinase [Acholeplasmatales bacterium]|nr:dihydropyrimidinase [Acholeplasmatales bacterium]